MDQNRFFLCSIEQGRLCKVDGEQLQLDLDCSDVMNSLLRQCSIGQCSIDPCGTKKSEQQVEHVRTVTAEAELQLSFVQEGAMLALRIEGSLPAKSPQFGYQSALSEQGGISLLAKINHTNGSMLSIYQHKEWWIRPQFCEDSSAVPPKSQVLIYQNGTVYHILLAVCGKNNRADLEGCEEGIWISLSSNLSNQRKQEDYALIYGQGTDPYALLEAMTDFGLRLTGREQGLRREKEFPELFGKLGWCTWDSLGQDVNAQAIYDKMDEWKEKKLPISWVLIDDGWSEANMVTKQLRGLGADQKKFPEGLAETIKHLKKEYQVSRVGVWQAIKGYWNGIEEDSAAAKELAAYLQRYSNGELSMEANTESVFGFWSRWHQYLKKAGVDFIKVDSQSSFALMSRGSYSYGWAANAIHTGLEASGALYFGGNVIHCMGMAPENIWNRKAAALSRNSDDFTPTVERSFAEHALQNCYNSIYHGCFYWGDWDMVWSEHEDAKRNILLRVMSGGPFYLSDGLGHTKPEAVWPAILPDATILRCADVARPTLDCLLSGETIVAGKKPLKIYNSYADTKYVAAFSLAEQKEAKAVEDQILLTQIPGKASVDVQEYVIYDWFLQKAQVLDGQKGYSYRLEAGDAALYQLVPVIEDMAVIGIVDKYLSGVCVERVIKEKGRTLILVSTGGRLAFWSRRYGISVMQNGVVLETNKQGEFYSVKVENGLVEVKEEN